MNTRHLKQNEIEPTLKSAEPDAMIPIDSGKKSSVERWDLERLSGVATWLVITVIAIGLMVSQGSFSNTHLAISTALCMTYLALWIFATSGSEYGDIQVIKVVATVVLFLNVIAIYFFIPWPFVAIFMVIFSGIMPFYMSIKRAFLLAPLWSLPLYLIYAYYWEQSGMLITAFLFMTFNIFSLVMVNTSKKEREARLETQTANQQLVATQSLLNEAVKQGERVRIARNIHDLLGHHLTALTIHLQVASRQSEGEVKKSIDQCHQLSKLLLSDVREAVSDIRDKSKIDLQASIASILAALPNLQAAVELDENINISDIHTADAIIKCIQESITNTLKHAKGKHMSIKLHYTDPQQQSLSLSIENDGHMPATIKEGNGLTGMKERLANIHGSVEFMLKPGKFLTHISIPVPQHD